MSRSSLGYGVLRSNPTSNQYIPPEKKMLITSVSNTIKMNPSEEISFISNNDKILDAQYRQATKTKYKGQTRNNKRSGYGEYMFENGDFYAGNWENDHPTGEGIYIFDNFAKVDKHSMAYIGNFEKGFFSGFGKLFTFVSPKEGYYIYQGNWRNGRRQGFGKQFYNQDENYFYAGYWYNDERNGEKNSLFFPNGEFQGSWENGKMQGLGKLMMQEGDKKTVIVGDWNNDQIKFGKITYYRVQGQREEEIGTYEGSIKDNKRQGNGIYRDKHLVYEGTFVNDMPEGHGRAENDHDHYKLSGNFHPSNISDLQFEIEYRNGDRYQGTAALENNMIKRKEGTYQYANGDKITGKFDDNAEGEVRGQNKYIWANGNEKNL